MSRTIGAEPESSSCTDGPRFVAEEGWAGALLAERHQDVADIAVDAGGLVYLLGRAPSVMMVCSAEGELRGMWGEDILSKRPHGVATLGGQVLVVDEGAHCVRIFDGSGAVVWQFGSGPSNPAFAANPYPETIRANIANIAKGYPPFTRPTRLAVAPNGDLFVSDGYGNSRVHRFDAEGRLLVSWGEPGTGPGQFHIPHAVFIDSADRVLVCDRENDRIQLFGTDGRFTGMWTDLRRPQAVAESADGLFYVAEGAYKPGHVSYVHGQVPEAASRVSICDSAGTVLQRIGGEQPSLPGSFVSAHSIAVYPEGFYVAQVALGMGRRYGFDVDPTTIVQKFRRVG